MAKYLLIFVLIIFIFPGSVNAQVVINEVLPNPKGEDSGAEWVELYNIGASPVSLMGCILYLHESDNNQKIGFKDDDFIERYKVVSWDDMWLNNSGDKVRLICSSYSDEVAYGDLDEAVVGSPKEEITVGRNPDGTGSFYLLSSITLGEANSLPPSSTPVPTDTPTLTPKPSPSPVPTSTPAPTLTPTKIPTPSPAEEESLQVLGVGEKKNDDEASESANEKSKKSFPVFAGIFILAGLGLISFPVINYIKQKKNII